MLVGRRIVIVFSRVEVEKWRMAEYRFLTGLTRLTGLGFSWSFEFGIRSLFWYNTSENVADKL